MTSVFLPVPGSLDNTYPSSETVQVDAVKPYLATSPLLGNIVPSFLFGVYLGVELLGHRVSIFLSLVNTVSCPSWLYDSIALPVVYTCSICSPSSPTFGVILANFSILVGNSILRCLLICISGIIGEAVHLLVLVGCWDIFFVKYPPNTCSECSPLLRCRRYR